MSGPSLLPLQHLLHSDRAPEAVIAFDGQSNYTAETFGKNVARLAAHVKGEGSGDWLIASNNAWELAAAIFAVLHAGGRPVLPANLQEGHLADLAAPARGVIGSAVEGALCLSSLPEEAASIPPAFDPEKSEIVLHTSGSSGQPEAFVKPFRCLQAEVQTLHASFAPSAPCAVLATVPAYHIYGLLFRILWPLAAGWPLDAQTIRYPGEVAAKLDTHGPSLLISSPAFLNRAASVMDWPALGALQGIFSSGGPLDPAAAATYNGHLQGKLREVYGSTETGGIGWRVVRDAAKPAAWAPLKGVTLSLAEDGRLKVTSPHIKEGVFQTEDLVELASDGSFTLKGRADRVVKIEERRISISEIERRLAAMEDISKAKCVPLERDGRVGLGAVIVPSKAGWRALHEGGKAETVRGLRAALAAHITPAGLPRHWRFVKALPQSAHGKVTEAMLQALFSGEREEKMAPVIKSETQEGSTARLALEVKPGIIWFDGHFDVAPVLPGLAQLAWAEGIARRLFGDLGEMSRLEVVKFFDVVPPETELTLELTHEEEKSRVLFHYWSSKGDHAKGRIVFGGGA
mgnify:CR=1 FL=1